MLIVNSYIHIWQTMRDDRCQTPPMFRVALPIVLAFLAVFTIGNGARAQVASQKSASYAQVPPHLAENHRKAIQAWQHFRDQEDILVSRIRDVVGKEKVRFLVSRGLLGDPNLQRYLYPWAAREGDQRPVSKPPEQHQVFKRVDWSTRSLHVVMVQEGNVGERKPGPQRTGGMAVHVSARGKPIELLLGAMESVRWRVTWDADVVLEKIVVSGNQQPEVDLQGPGPELIVLPPPGIPSVNSSVPAYSWNSYLSFSQNLKAITGTGIATIQGLGPVFRAVINEKPVEFRPGSTAAQSDRYRIVVDGQRNMALNPPSPKNEAVIFDGVTALTLDGRPILARGDGLTITSEDTRGGAVYPRAERAAGKWYWEAVYHRRNADRDFLSEVGVTDLNYGGGHRLPVHGMAVLTEKRIAPLPEVSTGIEAGVADFTMPLWYGMFAPAATPRDIVSRLSRELVSALGTPELRERLTALGVDPWPGTPEELGELLRVDIERYGKIARSAGLRKQ